MRRYSQLMRRPSLLPTVILVIVALGTAAVVYAYERTARPHLPSAAWERWGQAESDLTRQCRGGSQTALVRRAETHDVSMLVAIARAHPSATTPSGLTPQLRDPMNNMMGAVGSLDLPSCNRPDLMAEAWRVAASLPGGYTAGATPQQLSTFTRASDEFKLLCGRHDSTSVASIRRDASIMVALDRAAPQAGLLAGDGIEPPAQNAGSTAAPWIDLRRCDHRAVATLARGVGARPDQIGG